MIHVLKTRKGSTYTVDTDARTFVRTGAGFQRVTGRPVPYREIVVSADPRQGVRFLLDPEEDHWLRTSAIEEGHHDLYWELYHDAREGEGN